MTVVAVTDPLRNVARLYLRETAWTLTPSPTLPKDVLERIVAERAACEEVLAAEPRAAPPSSCYTGAAW